MVTTYLISPIKNSANQADKDNSRFIRKLLETRDIDFEFLPWRISSLSGISDEQSYSMVSSDKLLENILSPGNFIIINTSGYSHARTYFFEKSLSVPHRIHIGLDSHADFWGISPGLIGSDGFNAEILQLKNIDYGLFMGIVPNENLAPRGQSEENLKKALDKSNLYFLDDIEGLNSTKDPLMLKAYKKIKQSFPNISDDGLIGIPESVSLSGSPAYLSLDLDVLRDFPTFWKGHGRLDEGLLKELIINIGKRYNVIAGDICGVDIRCNPDQKSLETFIEVYHTLKSIIQEDYFAIE